VDADAESSVDVITVEQPAHTDEHQVQVVNGRTLHNPVHPARHELNTHIEHSNDCQNSSSFLSFFTTRHVPPSCTSAEACLSHRLAQCTVPGIRQVCSVAHHRQAL